MADGEVRIGVSGWSYQPWRGAFYPAGLPHKRELEFAASAFRALEINGTFYGLQRPDVFTRWAEETPDDFVFAVKAPRFITHVQRLNEPAAPLANFLASGVLCLGQKLGPMLWQLPPSLTFDANVMAAFLNLLPHDTDAAAKLAAQHDDHIQAAAWPTGGTTRRLRHAIEIRHLSFAVPAFIALLRQHDVALVCADTVDWPLLMDVTSDFVYCRLHGSEELYRSGYDEPALESWAGRIRAWSQGLPMADGTFVEPGNQPAAVRDVFVFFDNTARLRAPFDAQSLVRRLLEPLPA
jgi:uncharacterized protein YecE (DUF72 family)